jgi:hypothetical protein
MSESIRAVTITLVSF